MADDKWNNKWIEKINSSCGGSKVKFMIEDKKGEDNRQIKVLSAKKKVGFIEDKYEFNNFYNREAMEKYMDTLIDYCDRKQIGLQFDFILP